MILCPLSVEILQQQVGVASRCDVCLYLALVAGFPSLHALFIDSLVGTVGDYMGVYWEVYSIDIMFWRVLDVLFKNI